MNMYIKSVKSLTNLHTQCHIKRDFYYDVYTILNRI